MGDSSDNSDSDTGVGAEELNDGYGDIHKLILQGFMAAGHLNIDGVKKLFIKAHKELKLEMEDDNIVRVIRDMIGIINGRIQRYNLTIKSADCEITGKRAYMFAVTVESEMMQHQVYFTKFEVELFKRCVDLFLRESPDFTANSIDCINLSREIDMKGSLALAEKFIEKILEQQYLIKYSLDSSVNVEDYNLTLGARAIRELEPTILALYPDILVACGLCKKYLLHGYKCPGRGCGYFLHMGCCKTYLKTANNCPKCKKPWKLRKMIKRKREDEDGNNDEDGSEDGNEDEETGEEADAVPMATDSENEEEDTQLTPGIVDEGDEEMDTQLTPVQFMDMNSDDEEEDTQLTPITEDDEEAETQLTPVPFVTFPEDDEDESSTDEEDSSS